LNLVLIERGEVDPGGLTRLSDKRATHVRTILRAVPGQTVRVGILDGPLGVGTVESVADDAVEMRCVFDEQPPPRPRVDLLLALPRPKVMRRLWAQLAALGVGQIILTNAERVERNYFDTTVLSPDVYRPLLIAGLQQARDTCLPRVSIHRQFRILIEDHLDGLFPDGRRLVAHPAAARSVSEGARQSGAERILLAIGPEGGWNAFELSLLEAHGFAPVGLGARTLRSDTASVALLAVVHAAL
jgi:16S rRNA (uracil1498-N3)-methyltransferase